MVSIIIRTKDEERWIGHCLSKIEEQTFTDYEIIIVDDHSQDSTLGKAKNIVPEVKIIKIDEFFPGKALNAGIEHSCGEYIVCLSAHCIPVDEVWLEKLVEEIAGKEDIAGVYGRQIPMDQTHDIDKRDMLMAFGLDKRVQIKDSFFHNANSILRRDLWERHPFDEQEKNIEDRLWAEAMIGLGHKIVYTPESMVYHYHGLHQTNKNKRYKNIAKILSKNIMDGRVESYPIDNYAIYSMIPILAKDLESKMRREVFMDMIELISKMQEVERVVITTDDVDALHKAIELKRFEALDIVVLRREQRAVRIMEVYKDTLKSLNERGMFPDVLVLMDVSYPFKNITIVKRCLYELFQNDVDIVIPAYAEKRPTWVKKEGEYTRVDKYEVSKEKREAVLIGMENNCTIVYADILTGTNNFFDNKIELVSTRDPYLKYDIEDIVSYEEYHQLKQIYEKYSRV